MESLLRWGIEHSSGNNGQQQPTQPRKDLDPAIIDHILGKPDAVLMKEALDVALSLKPGTFRGGGGLLLSDNELQLTLRFTTFI